MPPCSVAIAERSASLATEYGTSSSLPGWASQARTFSGSSGVIAMNSTPLAPNSRASRVMSGAYSLQCEQVVSKKSKT